MSRTVFIEEATNHKDKIRRTTMRYFLEEWPPARAMISFKVYQDTEGCFRVKIMPLPFDARGIEFYLQDLPIIREYLRQIGALKRLYDETEVALLEQLREMKRTLLDEPDSGGAGSQVESSTKGPGGS